MPKYIDLGKQLVRLYRLNLTCEDAIKEFLLSAETVDVPYTNVGDTISRQAAIDALGERPMVWMDSDYEIAQRNQYDMDKLAIETVPPAQPERMRAKWIATTSLQEGQITWKDYKCSNCSHHRRKPMNFCEVCGAKMER